jgi:hypothetical protein
MRSELILWKLDMRNQLDPFLSNSPKSLQHPFNHTTKWNFGGGNGTDATGCGGSVRESNPQDRESCGGSSPEQLGVQFHQDSSYTSHECGDGRWSKRSSLGRGGLGSPVGALRAKGRGSCPGHDIFFATEPTFFLSNYQSVGGRALRTERGTRSAISGSERVASRVKRTGVPIRL